MPLVSISTVPGTTPPQQHLQTMLAIHAARAGGPGGPPWPTHRTLFSQIGGLAKWCCPEMQGSMRQLSGSTFSLPGKNSELVGMQQLCVYIYIYTNIKPYQHASKLNIHEMVGFVADSTRAHPGSVHLLAEAPKIQSAAKSKQNPCQIHGSKDGFSLWQPGSWMILEDLGRSGKPLVKA